MMASDLDDDDNLYEPEEANTAPVTATAAPDQDAVPALEGHDGDLEEGEEEDECADMDEDEDSDVDIITERKDGTKAPPPNQARYNQIHDIPQRTTSSDRTTKPAIKKENAAKPAPTAELPAVSSSKIDVNAIPIHKATGKPITQVNIDQDLPDNDKPWRKPGTDLSDFFNYGFDEFTWALYAAKQDTVRAEYSQDAIALNNKKMMEEMQMMMMGSLPGMTGGSGATPVQGMPGMEGMPPEMQQMMQQMMASGMDPSQMDPQAMTAMFGMQNSGGNGGNQGQTQSFGGAGPGFGNNQGQGYGFEQGMGRGGNFGRGRGGRKHW